MEFTKHLRYRFIPWILTPYYYLFTLIIWQPFIWDLIKPKSGTIDNKAHWFHRHSVTCLNMCRRGAVGFCLVRVCRFIIRDPHSHPMKSNFKYSRWHLLVWIK